MQQINPVPLFFIVVLARKYRNYFKEKIPVVKFLWNLARDFEHRIAPPPRFLIVGTGRSGTGYTSKLLTASGISCSHELVYSPWGIKHTFRFKGDASWIAVPFLSDFKGVVLHQVRHPISVIRSLVGIKFFSLPNNYYLQFASKFFRVTGDDLLDSMRWYVEWNLKCEEYAVFRFKVEEIAQHLQEIVTLIAPGVEEARIARVISSIRTDVNTRRRAELTFKELPTCPEREALFEMCIRYGYQIKE
jgi:hypothetical protein